MGNLRLAERLSAMREALEGLENLQIEEQATVLNALRQVMHDRSPWSDHPCELVLWVPVEQVEANDYNPNVVAAPEMELLRHSIESDGFTQPIVTYPRDNGSLEVVDGFHRNRVGREHMIEELHGMLPVTQIRSERTRVSDRMAATIRHNRARGQHQVDPMCEIVRDLKRRGWSDKRIGKELGMEPDEVLRLAQITGLAELFADRDFSEAWQADRNEA